MKWNDVLMMNILVITHMYPTDKDPVYGRFIHDQVKEMQRQGLNVKVICPIPRVPFPLPFLKRKWKTYSSIPEKTIYDGVEIYHPRYTLFPRSLFYHLSGDLANLAIKKRVRKLYQEFPFDLIHAHVALPSGYVGIKLAKVYNVPCMVTIHGKDLQSTVFMNHKCKEKIGYILQEADLIALVSEKLKRKIKDLFPNVLGKCHVIPNGVNLTLHNPLPSKTRHSAYILSVGNLYKSKGIETNLLAFKQIHHHFPEYKYIIIGDGPEKNNLQHLAKKLNVQDHVTFLGKVPHKEVLSYMEGCTIFSLPSWMEAFGIVYIEAMSFGKPIIACEGEGISDTIEHLKTGMLVAPKNVDALAETLTLLLQNPNLRLEMGEYARKLVSSTFSWEKNVVHYRVLFKKLVG